MNTAISTTWGFPNPPIGCTEYDCKNSEKNGRCGFNRGFCQNLPANFYINSVRIYQNKSDVQQSIGCNPKTRPTKRFIKAHDYRYCSTDQAHSLKSVVTGGGECKGNYDCGEGYCSFLRCRCHRGWQGLNCLVIFLPRFSVEFSAFLLLSFFIALFRPPSFFY